MRRTAAGLIIVLCGLASGANRYSVHGHDYGYVPWGSTQERVYFPVIWDLRTANTLLSEWHRLYGHGHLNPVFAMIDEAAQSGVNTFIVRSELGDRWFPEMPGTYGDKFFPLAGYIREAGLHIMPGGIGTALDCDSANHAVMDYLKLYLPMTAGDYPGDVTGMFAFDEPDVKYLENPGQEQAWMDYIETWTEACRGELGLSVLSYHSKFGTSGPSGSMEYYSDTTCVLNRIARYTDMFGMGMYPAKNNFRRTDLLHSDLPEALFTYATDMVQDDPLHIEAMNCRDELVRVFPQGDSAVVLVEALAWDGEDLHLETVCSLPLSFLPDGFAASDYRAGYAVHELDGYVNSGAVFWKSGDPVHEAVVMTPSPQGPIIRRLPDFPGSQELSPVFMAVGQTDYWSDVTDVAGIIGRGRLAVLSCLQDPAGNLFLMLFVPARLEVTPSLQPAFSEPRRLHFQATGAVWGTFWGQWYEFGTIQPVARNGFVIYGDNGDYITLNQLSRNYWQLFPAYGVSQYPQLFGRDGLPDMIVPSRDDGYYPPFFAGRDYLVGLFEDDREMSAVFSTYNGGPLSEHAQISVEGVSGDITGFDFLRDDYRYSDKPVFTTGAGDILLGTSLETGISGGTITVSPINYCQGDTIFCGVRAMHTRDAVRSVLAGTEGGFYAPNCELYDDVMDHTRFQWYPSAHATAMELGVEATQRDNVLFGVIQSYGRRGFALPTYCPSPDTLLYMATAPVVEGARGLVFYAMDISMMSGNGGDDGISRAPFLLQNWGPSRDILNVDMVGRVNEAVSKLTGHGPNSVDYLSKLVDDSWTVMDDLRAYNHSPSDSLLNFIALTNGPGDSIIVITVNAATSVSPFQPGITIENVPVGITLADCQGYPPDRFPLEIRPDGTASVELDYSSMPPLSASLITLTMDTPGQCQGTFLGTATRSGGTTYINFSLCDQEEGELALYDMAGRRLATLWRGAGTGRRMEAEVSRGDYPAGLYFAVLKGDNSVLSGKCILF